MSGTGQKAAEKAVSERYEALLRVSQTLISSRSSEELFRVLARELRSVVNFYVMGVGIYDQKAHKVRLTSYGEPGVPLPRRALGPLLPVGRLVQNRRIPWAPTCDGCPAVS
jgi:hypothetical protein